MANFIPVVDQFEGKFKELVQTFLVQYPALGDLGMPIEFGNIPNYYYFNTNTKYQMTAKTACGDGTEATGVNLKRKPLNPVDFQLLATQCYLTFKQTPFYEDFKLGVQNGEFSPEILRFIVDHYLNTLGYDLLALFTFSDTASSDAFFDKTDGLMKKLKTGTNTPSFTGDTLVKDAGAITAADLSTDLTSGQNILKTLQRIEAAQERKLRAIRPAEKRMFVTEDVLYAWENCLLENFGNTAVKQYAFAVDGVDATTFKGIPMIAIPAWSEVLNDKFTAGSPAEVVNPYRVILTDPREHRILLNTAGLDEIKTWYNEDEELLKMRSVVGFDYIYTYGEFNVIAGF